MTMISDLSQNLVEKILSRVPIICLRTVRSTCKGWNVKHCSKEDKYEFLVVMMYGFKACLTSVNLHGIPNHDDSVDPSIKQLGKLNKVEISTISHCNGLLLCNTRDNTKLMVWNPYLGQVRWIESRGSSLEPVQRCVIGYDSNNNYKILTTFYNVMPPIGKYEIYDFKSNSWRVFDGTLDRRMRRSGVSLKGNYYFPVQEKIVVMEEEEEIDQYYLDAFVLCFDFTRERFGPHLHLPFLSYNILDTMALSVVREEQLAVLFQRSYTNEIEIWITTKIELNKVSWRNFLKSDMKPFTGIFRFRQGTFFFVDEKKKVAVIFDEDCKKMSNYKAYMIGVDGYYKEVELGQRDNIPFVCSYIPSSVKIQYL